MPVDNAVSLDEAWAAAEAATVKWAEGARFRSVELSVFLSLTDEGEPVHYVAMADRTLHREADGPPAERHEEEAEGETPAAALQALAQALRVHE